ncbi:MAG: hypothetical protein KF729_08970 [Sandaracinaceae bacterium]|nr:hypothetical protein [Sandaracinaceae bacterium]
MRAKQQTSDRYDRSSSCAPWDPKWPALARRSGSSTTRSTGLKRAVGAEGHAGIEGLDRPDGHPRPTWNKFLDDVAGTFELVEVIED